MTRAVKIIKFKYVPQGSPQWVNERNTDPCTDLNNANLDSEFIYAGVHWFVNLNPLYWCQECNYYLSSDLCVPSYIWPCSDKCEVKYK